MFSGTIISWLRPVIGLVSQPASSAAAARMKRALMRGAFYGRRAGSDVPVCARFPVFFAARNVGATRFGYTGPATDDADGLTPQEARKRPGFHAPAALDPRRPRRNPRALQARGEAAAAAAAPR